MTRDRQDFETYRRYLRNEAQRLADYVHLYLHLLEHQQGKLRFLADFAPAFLGVTMDALFSGIVLWSHKLLGDKAGGKREIDFFAYLDFVERHVATFGSTESVTAATVEADRQRLKDLRVLPSIRLRRHKFHAHFDKDYFFDRAKLQKDAPIQRRDLEEVITVMGEILNRYSLAYDKTGYSLRTANITDIDHLPFFLSQPANSIPAADASRRR